MTNTNDFRRYSYQHDTSYLISGFDLTRGSAAPKRKPAAIPEEQEDRASRFKVRENATLKSFEEIHAEDIQSRRKMAAIVLLAMVIIGFVTATVYSFALKNELTRDIASIQVDIANAQSEGISLQSRLDAMVSISMIDEYAVNKLGMTKMKSNQIQYMDVSEYKHNRMKENSKQTPAQMAEALPGNK